jgi:hypothetical protein
MCVAPCAMGAMWWWRGWPIEGPVRRAVCTTWRISKRREFQACWSRPRSLFRLPRRKLQRLERIRPEFLYLTRSKIAPTTRCVRSRMHMLTRFLLALCSRRTDYTHETGRRVAWAMIRRPGSTRGTQLASDDA